MNSTRIISILAFVLLTAHSTRAQELDVDVTINTQQLPSDALDNLSDFAQQVKQYLNNTRWTSEMFSPADRIKCTLSIFFKGSPSTGRYLAQVFIGSQRKVWDLRTGRPTGNNTIMLRIFDENWEFGYTRGVQLTRNEFRFDPLTSFLDFYAYLILGFDFDSYESMGGTPHFQKALNIFNLSRSAGSGRGWEFPGSGTYNRTRLVDELASEKYKEFREAIYTYHAEGLDEISTNKNEALAKILGAIENLGKVKRRFGEQSLAIKTFFDTKYLELCEIFLDYPDETIYRRLSAIDPSHQKSYEEYQQKRR
jgi:hypothetical protein